MSTYRPDREEPPGPTDDGSDGDDFAAEHDDTTVADELTGGPEGAKEPESPDGRGGDGGMDVP